MHCRSTIFIIIFHYDQGCLQSWKKRVFCLALLQRVANLIEKVIEAAPKRYKEHREQTGRRPGPRQGFKQLRSEVANLAGKVRGKVDESSHEWNGTNASCTLEATLLSSLLMSISTLFRTQNLVNFYANGQPVMKHRQNHVHHWLHSQLVNSSNPCCILDLSKELSVSVYMFECASIYTTPLPDLHNLVYSVVYSILLS